MNSLVDNFGRKIEYLRISITERCNLHCRYCMPPDGIELMPKSEILTFDEIVKLAEIFVDLGIRKIRITGGEPLVRRDVEQLCARLANIPGLQVLALSTNGILLAKMAESLRKANVRQLNISLDTLRPERFHYITLRSSFLEVIEGIEESIRVGFPSVKINTVIIRGFNDDELLDFVDFAKGLSLNLRFIEYMPFWGNGWSQAEYMPCAEIKKAIETIHELVPIQPTGNIYGPAKEFQVVGSDAVIGFIATISEHACTDCNRLRLTANGKLRNCLFTREECDLRRLLRVGASCDIIENAITAAVTTKWKQHPDEVELQEGQHRAMTAIGG